MITKENEIKLELEDIFIRLEETRNNGLEMRDSNEIGLEFGDFGDTYTEDMEGLESVIFKFESFIDEIIQIIGEEIENLRALIEKVDGMK